MKIAKLVQKSCRYNLTMHIQPIVCFTSNFHQTQTILAFRNIGDFTNKLSIMPCRRNFCSTPNLLSIQDFQKRLQNSPFGFLFSTKNQPMNLKFMVVLSGIGALILFPVVGVKSMVLLLIPAISYVTRKTHVIAKKPRVDPYTNCTVPVDEMKAKVTEIFNGAQVIILAVNVPHIKMPVGLAVVEDLNLKLDIIQLTNAIPTFTNKCLLPVFVRISLRLDRSVEAYLKEAYNIQTSEDRVYYLNIDKNRYELITLTTYNSIQDGTIVF